MPTFLARDSTADPLPPRWKRWIGAAATGGLLIGTVSAVQVPHASAATGFQDLTVTQEFASSDDIYGSYETKNRAIKIELHDPNPAGTTYACFVSSTTPTGECFRNGDNESETFNGFELFVDSSVGHAYVEVDYAADPLASSPEVSKVYTVTWTPPTVLTTIPAGPTQAGNLLTFPSEPGIEYWVSEGWARVTGSYTMTAFTKVYSAPADGYVFADDEGSGWYYPEFRPVAPPTPTQTGNVLTIPTVEGVTYKVNGSTATGAYSTTANTTVSARAADFYFFATGTSSWNYSYSTSTPTPVAIRAAALKLTRKPTPTRGGRARYTTTSVNGAAVSGSGVLVMTKGKTVKKVTFTVTGGTATIRVPKLKRGTWKLKVLFNANAKSQVTRTKTYTVKV